VPPYLLCKLRGKQKGENEERRTSPHFSPPLLKKGGPLWHKLFC
jgi:hypothetical protein